MKAAAMFGYDLKSNVIERFGYGVNFLARYYGPDVWLGGLDSICDIPRQLAKLHVSQPLAQNVSAEQKLLEKSRSLWLTDSKTPIIGEIVSAVLRVSGDVVNDGGHLVPKFSPFENKLNLRNWCSLVDVTEQYPNQCEDWADHYLDLWCATPDWSALRQNVSMIYSDGLAGFIQGCLPVLEVEPAIKEQTVVNGDVLGPEPIAVSNEQTTVNATNPKQVDLFTKTKDSFSIKGNKSKRSDSKGKTKAGGKKYAANKDRKQFARGRKGPQRVVDPKPATQ